MYLHEVNIGDTFKVADVEFIKFTNDGDKVIAVAKDSLYDSRFGNDANFGKSDIKARLEKELLPKLEAEIGEENIFEFETDLLAFDGTRPFPNVKSKISLVTLDFYRHNREIFDKHLLDDYWWLSTPDSEAYKRIALSVSPSGGIYDYDSYGNNFGVRPFCILKSNIFVS